MLPNAARAIIDFRISVIQSWLEGYLRLMNTRYIRSAAIPILVVTLIAFFLVELQSSKTTQKNNFPKLYSQIDKDQVKTITVTPSKNEVTVTPQSDNGKAPFEEYSIGFATDKDLDTIQNKLTEAGNFKAYQVQPDKGPGILGYFLQFILPIGLIILFWLFIMNQMQGGGSKVMSFGKSRAKRQAVDAPKVSFRDVAGADEAVMELEEIKEFLENPKKFQA